jgi:7-cyano-7-deazaguanine synthase in queuosine biosynthesis
MTTSKNKVINSNKIDQNRMKDREDLEILDSLDQILRNKRGYVIKLPKPNTPVIACMSGGLDSIANIVVLLEALKVKVYPFFINRGQTNYKWEKEAVNFYNRLFLDKYPNLYTPCLTIDIDIPSKAYKKDLIKTKCLEDNPKLRSRASYPARNPIIFLTGMEYGYSLQHKGIEAKTIFGSMHSADNAFHSSLTSIRSQNITMCTITGDWDWQFISIPIERELGNYYGKSEIVKFAHNCGIPLEQTRSCTGGQEIQCGLCTMACMDRRKAFKEAGIKDRTIYLNSYPKSEDGWVITK